ncbi:MAG TPA: M15 family metallopeptidase [Chitinophagales bacterium]|nr:M15 family metallopeptidase [Chitinophagales bacterium]HNL84880.1 M15 family metallopeptidase [Chitinophagales bacterium]
MRKSIMILLGVVNLLIACQNKNVSVQHETIVDIEHSSDTSANTFSERKDDIINIPSSFCKVNLDSQKIINKMAYATSENFTKQKLYPCASCYLRNEVAIALSKAQHGAQKMGLVLVVFDCYRPYSIQKKMFEIVGNSNYVAHPGKGSMHNKGCAVDVSLAEADGKLLDMGTEFDDFTEAAHFANTAINRLEHRNRKQLRDIMTSVGFLPYNNEWWHFNYLITDSKTEDFVWSCP